MRLDVGQSMSLFSFFFIFLAPVVSGLGLGRPGADFFIEVGTTVLGCLGSMPNKRAREMCFFLDK